MSCRSCGMSLAGDARFCPSCGTPVEAPTAGEQPGAARPPISDAAAAVVPRWLTTDWPVAIIVVLCWLAIAAGAGALAGFIPAAIINGFGPESLVGALAGSWFGFAGLGADTTVAVTSDQGAAVWSTGGLVLTVAIGLALLASAIMGRALLRVGRAADYTLAFIGKVALVGAIAVALTGSVVSLGDRDELGDVDGFAVTSDVGVGEAVWITLLVLGLAGLWAARGRLTPPAWTNHLGWARPLRYGAAAWLIMAACLGLGVSTFTVAKGDDNAERFAGTSVAPLLLMNTGSASAAIAMGASDDTNGDTDDVDPTDPRLDEHLSLFHWSIPPDDDMDAAPLYLWPVLVIAPLFCLVAARRYFLKDRPRTAGRIISGGLAVASGFALAAWLGALLAPLSAVGAAFEVDGVLDLTGRAALLHPSVAATFGLALLWALIGALVSAFLWAARNRIDLIGSFSSARQPAGARRCTSCGSSVGDAPFCERCGAAQGTSTSRTPRTPGTPSPPSS